MSISNFFSRPDHGGFDETFLKLQLEIARQNTRSNLNLKNNYMGTFKIEIIAVGNHGMDRSKKDGEVVNFYDQGNTTPDAIAKNLTELLKYHGASFGITEGKATITHWPDTPSEVVDDLLTGKRKGNF